MTDRQLEFTFSDAAQAEAPQQEPRRLAIVPPSADVLPFPLARRVHYLRRVVDCLGAMPKGEAEAKWRGLLKRHRRLRRELGMAEEAIDADLLAFAAAVRNLRAYVAPGGRRPRRPAPTVQPPGGDPVHPPHRRGA
ncbi:MULTISPECIES: DUF6074 family protein [unclassified Chelatococcus]|uniref:DUF6074 family protein n=1 Tax=unclassified Chelatococcus TaxID=2638111 RepID=UPI0002FB7341|nr:MULTISPECIES: DUF6074 family protein [unclassified Chelatococcus]ALA17180.1 hypothetical protein AL346_06885 [Chelatococcus sp. CO-6]